MPPLPAAAKFAVAGKTTPKKDLAMLAMSYGHAYVAKVAMGAKDGQTLKAFLEAESFDGPSLILAYSHCIAHGYDLAMGAEQQKLAVDSGYWPLFRYDPRRVEQGQSALVLDSAPPKGELSRFLSNETRFRMVEKQHPEAYKAMIAQAQVEASRRFATYEQLARLDAASGPVPGKE